MKAAIEFLPACTQPKVHFPARQRSWAPKFKRKKVPAKTLQLRQMRENTATTKNRIEQKWKIFNYIHRAMLCIETFRLADQQLQTEQKQ